MSSITKESNGRKTVQFIGVDKERRSIRLGKVPLRAADVVKLRVEMLVSVQLSGHAIDDETARWLDGLDEAMTEKLAAVGLASKRMSSVLDEFLTTLIDGLKKKPNTIRNLNQAKGYLIEYLGAGKRLQDVPPGDADGYRPWLEDRVGINTARRHVSRAKQFFRAALRKRLIRENPFADIGDLAVQPNKSRELYVSQQAAQAVLEACLDT